MLEAKSMNIDPYQGLSALSSPPESSRQFLTQKHEASTVDRLKSDKLLKKLNCLIFQKIMVLYLDFIFL